MNLVVGGNHKLAYDILEWLISKNESVRLVITENLDSTWEFNFESLLI